MNEKVIFLEFMFEFVGLIWEYQQIKDNEIVIVFICKYELMVKMVVGKIVWNCLDLYEDLYQIG